MKDYRCYHNYKIKDKITNDAFYILERTLKGYAGYDVIINDEKETRVLIYQKYDSDGESYKIVGHIEDIERGNLVTYLNDYWLIVNKPENNRVYNKSEIRLCTATFPIVTLGEELIIGYDKLNRPIYGDREDIIDQIPCVVNYNSRANADVNEPINLLHDQIKITIQYTESPSLQYNERFNIYNDEYRIIRIDYTDSINKVGIIHITGERVQNVKWGE